MGCLIDWNVQHEYVQVWSRTSDKSFVRLKTETMGTEEMIRGSALHANEILTRSIPRPLQHLS